MMDLTVEIEGDIGTLEEALRQFTSTETLDGENKYQCSRLAELFYFTSLLGESFWCYSFIVRAPLYLDSYNVFFHLNLFAKMLENLNI